MVFRIVMTDQEIIQGFLEGKTRVFAEVKRWIEEVVHARTWINEISPDDIVSDSITKVLHNLRSNKFNSSSSLKTYAQTIARNTIIDAVRRHERIKELLQKNPPNTVEGDTPLDALINKEELMIFDRILTLIDTRCRQMWIMVFHEGLSYARIADRINTTEGAVRTRFFRCKEEAIAIKNRLC